VLEADSHLGNVIIRGGRKHRQPGHFLARASVNAANEEERSAQVRGHSDPNRKDAGVMTVGSLALRSALFVSVLRFV
jgi:hypothetical protein